MKLIIELDGDLDDAPEYLKLININNELVKSIKFEVEQNES